MQNISHLPALVRGARALFGWSVSDLGEKSGVSANTLRAWESLRSRRMMAANEEKLLAFLKSEGVEFSESDGRLSVSIPVPQPALDLVEPTKAKAQ